MTASPLTAAADALTPTRERKFQFGLWTVGNPGRDPFGGPTREPLDPADTVRRLAEAGAWGVGFHDDDLVPWGSSAAERDRIVARFRAALDETGLVVGSATTNLFGHPAFKDGAFTSNDRGVRRAAIGKAMRSIDLGAELGAPIYVFWGGREGTEAGVAKDPRDALERYREAIDVLGDYVVDQGYDCASRSSPSRTSRGATSSCPPSGTRCTSSRRSSARTWSA
jgi:xylose isomerase